MEPDPARHHLEAEHARLEHVLDALEVDHLKDASEEDSSSELSHMDQHPADAASDAFEREKDISILEKVQAELGAVERALQRLDNGTYGKCESCGAPIGDDRLEVVPATRFCIKHQPDAEI